MIGNAHLDLAWLWPCWEGFHEVIATFRSAVERMEEYPDFRFAASSAAYYEWVEQTDPLLFEAIRRRVEEGRWELVGGWWVEPDLNVPGGESLVRQALLGQRFFKDRFGRPARVGYNVDSFGHPASLPQILRKSGLTAYVFMRPQPHELALPARLFRWESEDGSRVLAFRVPFEYGSVEGDPSEHIRRCAEELSPLASEGMCFYGVGNHGGGPTRANIEVIHRMRAEAPDELDIEFSTPSAFFESVSNASALPVVRGELQHHASGCYAAHSAVKRLNRRAENLLLSAEKFSAIARHVTGLPVGDELTRAWKSVLVNQFHDILAGTSIASVDRDVRDSYGEAGAIANRALHRAVQALAFRVGVEAREGSQPIVVFNPHPWPARLPVELETDGLHQAEALEDDAGGTTPLQTVASEATVGPWRRRVAFLADLPPLGYRVLWTRRQDCGAAPLTINGSTLENGRWRIAIDPLTGFWSSLYDLQADVELLAGPGARPVVIDDASDTWGHGVTRFQDVVGEFKATSVRAIEQGQVRSLLRVESEFSHSRLIQDIALYAGSEVIEVRARIDWRDRHRALKLRWPVNVMAPLATYEIPFGHAVRPVDGEEEPAQGWVDVLGIHSVSRQPYGLSLLNDGKSSFDVQGSTLSMTLLRSPAYAHHDPHRPESWDGIRFLDQGEQEFTYALLPHPGGWDSAHTVRRAAELNQPAIAFLHTSHPGDLPSSGSFVAIEPPAIVLTALKPAEDGGEDVVLRCYESTGRPERATIQLPAWNRTFQVDFGAFEIKTFRVPADAGEVVETDLLEWR
jgi:alpha-mannosidase